MTNFDDQILDIWRIHSRINLEILDTIDEDDLSKRSPHYETTIGGQFAHIHKVRWLWLQRVPEFADGINEIDEASMSNKTLIKETLISSAERVEIMLQKGVENDGKLSYFQPHVGAFVGYLIAHECMHQGEIGMILGEQGKELPLEVVWDWNQV
jgi:uncharacterized damage-inducible protein DinB